MAWLIFAISAYFINAVNAVIDKFLLGEPQGARLAKSGKIPEPIVYSFYVGLLSIFALIIVPFAPSGFIWPGTYQFLLSIAVGSAFLLALIAYFTVMKRNEASRVVPVIGGFTPIFVFLLSYVILGERLDKLQMLAFLLLVIGGVLMSLRKNNKKRLIRFSIEDFEIVVISAFLFAIFYVGMKLIFAYQPFVSGFVWSRMGSFLTALGMLLFAENRRKIFHTAKTIEFKIGGLFVFNKASAGLAFLLQNLAISLGSVIFVNAVQGVQYVFLFGLTTLISKKAPQILEEQITPAALLQKVFAILLISIGLLVLAFYHPTSMQL